MYKVVVNKFESVRTVEKILITTKEELRTLVNLADEGDYEILSLERIDQEGIQITAALFLKEIKEKIKPTNLVYGVDEKKLKKNYKKELDKKLKRENK